MTIRTFLSTCQPLQRTRVIALLGSIVLGASLAGCAREETPFAQARSDNLGRHVASGFDSTAEVLADKDASGLDVVRRLFDSSATLVIAGQEVGDQLRAASLAVFSHAPMLVMNPNNRDAVLAEIDRLGVRTVLAVGKVDLADASGDLKVIKDPGTYVALGEMTAFQFDKHPVTYRELVIDAVADLEDADPQYLYPGWIGAAPTQLDDWASAQGLGRKRTAAFPAQSKRDGGLSPVVIASRDTSIAAVASARSFGAEVRVFPVADPRFSEQTFEFVAGLADQPLLVLGTDFGTAGQLREKILLGESQWERASGGDYSGLLPSQGSGAYGLSSLSGSTTSESIIDTGIMFPQRTLIGPLPVALTELADESAVDRLLADAEQRQSNYSRGHDGRSVPTVVVTLPPAFDAEHDQQSVDPSIPIAAADGLTASELDHLDYLIRTAGDKHTQVIIGVLATDLDELAQQPVDAWPEHLVDALDNGYVSLAVFSARAGQAEEAVMQANQVNIVAQHLNDFAKQRGLAAKGLFLVERRAGRIANPEILRGDFPLVQVMVVADTVPRDEEALAGVEAASETAGESSASDQAVTELSLRQRTAYEDIMVADVGARLPRGYSGVRGIFSGWMRGTREVAALEGGHESAVLEAAKYDYTQLSPRPWLVLGP